MTVTATITGLAAGDSYHFRVVARNASGTGYGADQAFSTQLPMMLQAQAPGAQGTPPGAPEAPPAQATWRRRSAPDAELASTLLTASSSGTVGVELRCPAAESSCAGTVTLRTLVGLSAAARRHRRAKTAMLTLAEGSFEVAGGHVVALRLQLSARARALLARTRILRGRATIFARDPADTTHTAQAAVTIRMRTAPRGHNS